MFPIATIKYEDFLERKENAVNKVTSGPLVPLAKLVTEVIVVQLVALVNLE